MTLAGLIALLPFLVLAGVVVVAMLGIAVRRSLPATAAFSLIGLALAFAALFAVPSAPSRRVTSLLVVDNYALFFLGLILAAAFVVGILAYGYLGRRAEIYVNLGTPQTPPGATPWTRPPLAPYLKRQGGEPEEFYLLLLLATVGSAVLVASSHFVSFFLGLEILSVSLYALIAYSHRRDDGVEAGIKYLILAGVSSAFLLFGMALIYAELGTMEFGRIASSLAAAGVARSPLWLAGMAMLIVGIGFKLAVVPFHLWTPDVYEGAPAPTTAFVATVSKGAMFALLLRYFTEVDYQRFDSLSLVFLVIAVASMLVGNLLALLQTNVKRLLAYSSISHLGYLLVAFLAGGPLAPTAVAFYLVAYFVTTLGAFGVVTVLSRPDQEAEDLEEYRGLAYRRPWLAGVFAAMLLSLAGIPLTAGFVGKFYVVVAGVGMARWLPVIVLVVASAIGVFYYLRVVAALYTRPQEGAPVPAATPAATPAASLALALLTLLLVWLGVYPGPLIQLIQATVGGPI